MQVWDTAGQERFRTITTAYYRGAMGIVLIYDVTDSRSFENVENWFQTVTQHANEDAQIFLVGNKCDDEVNRQVSKEQGQELAAKLNVPFWKPVPKAMKTLTLFFTNWLVLSKRSMLKRILVVLVVPVVLVV